MTRPKKDKLYARRDYVFGKDLTDSPVVVTLAKYNEHWVIILESLPVKTQRDPDLRYDIVSAHTTLDEARAAHQLIIQGRGKKA